MENQNLAIFITEDPCYNEEQGTEYMTWLVFVAMEIDDDAKYTRHYNYESAYNHAESIAKRYPNYEFVGLS